MIGVLAAIEFDNEAPLNTAEIRKIRPYSMLPAEFETAKALRPEMRLQLALLWC
jgi:hypothetical protein